MYMRLISIILFDEGFNAEAIDMPSFLGWIAELSLLKIWHYNSFID